MNCTTTHIVATPNTAKGFAGLRWLFAVWIATALLFAHGCHGPEEDHELSVLPMDVRGERQPEFFTTENTESTEQMQR